MDKSCGNHLYHVLGSEENNRLAAQAFLEDHISVGKLDLQTGEVFVMKSDLDWEIAGLVFDWTELLKRYVQQRVYPPDRELASSFTLEWMREFCLNINPRIELRSTAGENHYEWVEMAAYKVGADAHTALVCTKSINETKLVRSIVDLFVYQNYDYLILIDTINDSYTRFTGSKGNIPVPPEKGENYTADMIAYNCKYVAPEDCERVTANMQIPHILRMLKHSDSYSFTSGGLTEDGGYRRSRIMFLSYDKPAGLILCARTNVTQIYLEEQEKSRQLHEALQSAQLDAMTGIFNPKATAELVARSLENQYHKTAALLFIDVDNFKIINDTLGHQIGDALLCFLARSIQEIAGRKGIAGRLGGDEYLLYLPDVSSVSEIEEAAGKLCGIFSALPADFFAKGVQQDMISCSVGVSVYPRDGTDYETLLRKADQALYTSKRYGKKRYYLYSLEVEKLAVLDQTQVHRNKS